MLRSAIGRVALLVGVMPIQFPIPPTAQTKQENTSCSKFSSAHIAAFRDCYQRYQECLEYRGLSSATLNEDVENYVLDFELAAKRSLGTKAKCLELFRMLFLQGHAAEDCRAALKMDVFTIKSTALQVEAAVGEALIRRGLFPVNKYFTNVSSQPSSTTAKLGLLAA